MKIKYFENEKDYGMIAENYKGDIILKIGLKQNKELIEKKIYYDIVLKLQNIDKNRYIVEKFKKF